MGDGGGETFEIRCCEEEEFGVLKGAHLSAFVWFERADGDTIFLIRFR